MGIVDLKLLPCCENLAWVQSCERVLQTLVWERRCEKGGRGTAALPSNAGEKVRARTAPRPRERGRSAGSLAAAAVSESGSGTEL